MEKSVMRRHLEERFGSATKYSMKPDLPCSLNVELNNTCNHKCVFCPFHGELANKRIKPAIMEEEFAKAILKQASDLGIGQKEVGFYIAGEAFLYKGLTGIIKYAKELGFSYTFITTNGALATPDRMEAILDAGLDSIRFSVNGGNKTVYEEIHKRDDFDKVLENIKYLYKRRAERGDSIAISLSSVVTKNNKEFVGELKDTFSKYVDDIMFIPIILDNLRDLEQIKDEWQLVEDVDTIDYSYVCSMLFDTMYINAFGKVVPCCDAYHADVEFYDLKKNLDLLSAWNSEGYKRYRDIFVSGSSDKGTICEKCILRREGVGRLAVDDLV